MSQVDSRTELERSLVSAAVLGSHWYHEVCHHMQGQEFRGPEARAIWPVITEHINKGIEPDFVAIVADLVRLHPHMRESVVDIFFESPAAAHLIHYYAGKIRQLNTAEDLQRLGEQLRKDPEPEIDDYLTRLDALRLTTPDEVCTAAQAMETARERRQRPRRAHATGLRQIDIILRGGVRDGQLVIVGGRPGTGKSVLMAQMACEAATVERPVLYVSCEMPRYELIERLASRFSDSDAERLPLLFIDSTSNWDAIQTLIKLQHRRSPLGMVVVDYLQLLEVKAGRNDMRHERVASISRGLKRLALDLELPIVAGSQLSRAAAGRDRPTLADLRESGAIEQDADIVILIAPSGEDDEQRTTLEVAKHRGGPTGKMDVELIGHKFHFREIDHYAGLEKFSSDEE